MTIKSSDTQKISQIFTVDTRIFYNIPKYQREYTWGNSECEKLFNDIIENENGYFLGSLICVNSNQPVVKGVALQVIDGQQRLTSLSILLLALYCKINEKKEELDNEQKKDLQKIEQELVTYDRNTKCYIPRLKLQSQNHNCDDYFSLLSENGFDIGKVEKFTYAGNRAIYRAFNRFMRFIEDYLESNTLKEKNKVDALFELYEKISEAVVVLIEVDSNKDAYMMFESLNNRGIPLSAIDLIKNTLISKAETPTDSDSTEKCYEQWKTILSYLTDEYKIQERFFRQFYNTFRTSLNEPFPSDKNKKYFLGPLATRSTLLGIYEELIKADYQKLLDNLEVEAQNYSIIIGTARDELKIKELEEPLFNLNCIQGAPSYILLMYLLSNKDKLELSNSILADIINCLVKFFVRRNITDFPNTRNLTKIFMDTVLLIEDLKGVKVYNVIESYLYANSSTDENFDKALKGPIYLTNTDSTRYLLCHYESKYKTKENNRNFWERDSKNKFIWTIEHILPEGNNIPSCWIEMIAGGDKSLAREYLEKYVHNLGNLTLTGYNSNLSNMSFEDKKNRKKGESFIGYKNGLKLNEDVVSEDAWTKDKIEKRTEKMVNIFLEDFKFSVEIINDMEIKKYIQQKLDMEDTK